MWRKFKSIIAFNLLIAIACLSAFAQVSRSDQFIEVPFDFYRDEIFVQVKINGLGPFNMMLDTGADPSAVDLATAKQIGLKLSPIGRHASGGGTSVNLAYETGFELLEVGSLVAKNIEAVAVDLSKVGERLGKPIQGVIGHSLLSGRIVQIDYPKRVVRFYAKSPFSKDANQPNTSKRTVLRFRYADNVLIDDVSVNGKKVVGNLDTGSDGTFKLTPDAVSLLGLEADVSKAQASKSVGYNGTSENKEGRIRNVTVGGISIDSPTVIFFSKGTGRDKRAWGINIGNEFLKNFVVTIDYRNKLILLERP